MVTKHPLKNKKVLVTCGPTWVAIDDVRVISNCSSGELGHRIATLLKRKGAKVTVLEGPVLHRLQENSIRIVKFRFYDELSRLVNRELKKHYDVIIHSAAVSDYKLKNVYKAKLDSRLSHLTFHLVPTVKIIERIKKRQPKTFLIGFKLEPDIKREAVLPKVRDLIFRSRCDLVVVNAMKGNRYEGYIIDSKRNILSMATSRKQIAQHLVEALKKRL